MDLKLGNRMTNLVIKKPLSVYLPVAGSESNFPVRRVYCIGRNYAEHAREMGHDPDRDHPLFFQKNRQAHHHGGVPWCRFGGTGLRILCKIQHFLYVASLPLCK